MCSTKKAKAPAIEPTPPPVAPEPTKALKIGGENADLLNEKAATRARRGGKSSLIIPMGSVSLNVPS